MNNSKLLIVLLSVLLCVACSRPAPVYTKGDKVCIKAINELSVNVGNYCTIGHDVCNMTLLTKGGQVFDVKHDSKLIKACDT